MFRSEEEALPSERSEVSAGEETLADFRLSRKMREDDFIVVTRSSASCTPLTAPFLVVALSSLGAGRLQGFEAWVACFCAEVKTGVIA